MESAMARSPPRRPRLAARYRGAVIREKGDSLPEEPVESARRVYLRRARPFPAVTACVRRGALPARTDGEGNGRGLEAARAAAPCHAHVYQLRLVLRRALRH